MTLSHTTHFLTLFILLRASDNTTGKGRRVVGSIWEFIPPQAKIYPHDINHDLNSVERYTQELFNFSKSY